MAVPEILDPEHPQLAEEASEKISIAEEDMPPEEAPVSQILDPEQPQLAEKTSEETSIAEEENHSEEEGVSELPDSELPQEAEERSTETSAVEENIQDEESAASAAPIAEPSHEVSTEVLDKLLVNQCKEPSLETVMKKALLFFCSSEQMYFHYYNGGHAYAGTIMIHTVIGAGDLDDTMSFLKRFYIEELHESFTPSDVPKSIQLLITELAMDFDSDEVVKGKLNGLYQIGFQFKCACRCFPDAMAEIIFCLLYNLGAYHHNTSNISYTPAVFYKYFKRWKISDILHERSQKKCGRISRLVSHHTDREDHGECSARGYQFLSGDPIAASLLADW